MLDWPWGVPIAFREAFPGGLNGRGRREVRGRLVGLLGSKPGWSVVLGAELVGLGPHSFSSLGCIGICPCNMALGHHGWLWRVPTGDGGSREGL